jgi:hypothetical protein
MPIVILFGSDMEGLNCPPHPTEHFSASYPAFKLTDHRIKLIDIRN